MYALESLTYESQTLNTEQKHAADDITDKIVELEKVLVALKVTTDNTHIDLDKEQVEKKQLWHTVRQKKTEAEKSFTDIIRQFSNRNRKPPQEPEMASTKFHITSMARLRQTLAAGGLARQLKMQTNLTFGLIEIS